VFNLASLGRYHLHDVEHHLHDVSYLADRVTAAAYDAHAEDYAAGTSAMPDEVNANMVRFVDAVGTEARVLEIGTGPGRDAMEMERIGLSVRRTDVSEGFVSRLHAAGSVADRLDPLTDDLTDPLRGGAPYDGVWANASLLHVRRELLPAVLERLAAVTRPGGALHVTLKGGDGARWSVHGNVSAPRYFTFWREDALREVLTAAGWLVDDVEHGESTPADRPSEEWLAVFATRAPRDAED
jgi:SAM-dependent methyltransferase